MTRGLECSKTRHSGMIRNIFFTNVITTSFRHFDDLYNLIWKCFTEPVIIFDMVSGCLMNLFWSNDWERYFFDFCRKNAKMKMTTSSKIKFNAKTEEIMELYQKKLRANKSFLEVSSFTSLSGGNHNWRLTAGWK